MRRALLRNETVAILWATSLLIPSTLQAQGGGYTVVDLHPAGFTLTTATGISGGRVVGWGRGSATGGVDHALTWRGSAETLADLHPTEPVSCIFQPPGGTTVMAQCRAISSAAFGIATGGGAGDRLVGNATLIPMLDGVDIPGMSPSGHRLLWFDNPGASLNPAGYSDAFGPYISAGGDRQFGVLSSSSGQELLLWSGTAESYVRLTPAGALLVTADGTDGVQQVGSVFFAGALGQHAAVWAGSAESFVDLNPDGFFLSVARGVRNGQQVGSGAATPGNSRALLWFGTADSVVDLGPGIAYATNGRRQVGATNLGRAAAWSGTAASLIDLHPSAFLFSGALAIDENGDIAGYGIDATGTYHALLWKAPQPVDCSGTSAPDSDGDGLCDQWETSGILDDEGNLILDLPSMGADPNRKDIFVETDFMTDEDHTHRPNLRAINRVIDAFDRAGISLHVDCGPHCPMAPGRAWGDRSEATQLPHSEMLGSIDAHGNYRFSDCAAAACFETIKDASFNPARRQVFHYAVMAHDLPNGLWGISRGLPGSDFIVALGSADHQRGNPQQHAGVFMHELGHNLSLLHGGLDFDNHKPNHLSVMNSLFTLGGLTTFNAPGWLDYSRFGRASVPDLEERNSGLNEAIGLNAPTVADRHLGTAHYCPADNIRTVRPRPIGDANGPIDWDCDETLEGGVTGDVNADTHHTRLSTFNEWQNLVFTGGLIGAFSPSLVLQSTSAPQEDSRWLAASQLPARFSASLQAPMTAQVPRGGSVELTLSLTNLGSEADTYELDAESVAGWGEPALSANSATLQPGETRHLTLMLHAGAAASSGGLFIVGATSVAAPLMEHNVEVAVTVLDDVTGPELTLPTAIMVDAASASGVVVTFSATAVDATDGSVNVACTPQSGTLFPVGASTVNCTAVDLAGNSSSGSFVVTVRPTVSDYDFSGFYGAVDNPPVFNELTAGRAVALKFSLGGNRGLQIFSSGYPTSQQMACNAGAIPDVVEETVAEDTSVLTYNSLTTLYTFAWKTNSSWTGTCRRLVIRFGDGTEHAAYFSFR